MDYTTFPQALKKIIRWIKADISVAQVSDNNKFSVLKLLVQQILLMLNQILIESNVLHVIIFVKSWTTHLHSNAQFPAIMYQL